MRGYLTLEILSGAELANGVQVRPVDTLRICRKLQLLSGVSEAGSG